MASAGSFHEDAAGALAGRVGTNSSAPLPRAGEAGEEAGGEAASPAAAAPPVDERPVSLLISHDMDGRKASGERSGRAE